MTEPHKTYDPEEIRARISFPDLVGKDLGELSRCSGHFLAPCPFHDERSASFHIYEDHGHCYGCGWHGDVFNYHQSRNALSFPETLAALASLVGIEGTEDTSWKDRKYKVADGPKKGSPEARVKPICPPFRKMGTPEILALAKLRGLNPLAVRVAAHDFRRIGFCEWPQWQRKTDGRWMRSADIAPAWVVTDDARWCVQYRRMDGQPYEMKQGDKLNEVKAWTNGSPKWPIGSADIGDKTAVMLVEGGADMLAAYHFLFGFELLEKVAVVAILGASCRIADDALELFKGKRVRIMMDADEPKKGPKGRMIIPSKEAAMRWQAQLTAAGAAVETFSLYGLSQADGTAVGDLNDLAFCDAETLNSEEIRDAFFCWDF